MKKSIGLAGIAMLVLAAGLISPTFSPAEGDVPHHLVGHEEAELLLRIQDVIDDWDPRKLQNPLVVTARANGPDGQPKTTRQLRRSDLGQFIADVEAAEALGKAFFWDMQAGSDFRKRGEGPDTFVGTACASCHYRHGADARARHSRLIPYVAWDQYQLHSRHPLEFGERQQPYPVVALATQTYNVNDYRPAGPFSLIVGSQGVEPRIFKGFKDPNAPYLEELSEERSLEGYQYRPQWSMFIDGSFAWDDATKQFKKFQQTLFRQITPRNSPTVINSGFSDRLFHDGRAESTFNGFSIFGDADRREVIHRVVTTPKRDANGQITNEAPLVEIKPVNVALTNAALASQAVGPIVNNLEMSYLGREFPHVAYKLLDAKILGYQKVDPTDSLLGTYSVGQDQAEGMTYRTLIQRAFRSEWWDDSDPSIKGRTPLIFLRDSEPDAKGELIVGNFSLFWGLSIMLYEASLVSNQSPFDEMMRGRPEMVEAKWNEVKNDNGPDGHLQPIRRDQKVATPPPPEHESGSAVFQHGFRVFRNRGCVDCHDGPLFSETSERLPEEERLPIHYRMERALLPNSRSDALAANLRQARIQLIRDLETQVKRIPGADLRATKVAIELDELRHSSHGVKSTLQSNIQTFLQTAFSPTPADYGDISTRIAELLFRYEKSLVRRMGNRTFFSEDERIAMAEAIGEPLLVEKMPIPPNQLATRPKLPIAGPLAQEGYAFYDTGFYVLGVSLPRYDRGNGDKRDDLNAVQVQALMEAVQSLQDSNDVQQKARATEAIKSFRNDGDVKRAVESIPEGARAIFDQKVQELRQSGRKSASEGAGAPGRAYRFRGAWRTEQFKSQGYSPLKERKAAEPKIPSWIQQIPEWAPDDQELARGIDTSWDRIDLPYGALNPETGDDIQGAARRNDYYFFSRARQLVFDEQHWGYRKPLLHDNELAFWGAFKTPTLRNIELTAPYMHNGRLMTLTDVVEFYDDHANEAEDDEDAFAADRARQLPRDLLANPDKHPAIGDVDLTDHDKRALVFFLRCLTDDRVRYEKGPFDHPSIRLPQGYAKMGENTFVEQTSDIDEVGRAGRTKPPTQ